MGTKFEQIREIMGDKLILDELAQYMSSDDLSEFIEHLESMYDIEY